MAKVMDGYVRVSRIGGREGEAYRSPGIQRAEIENLARVKGVRLGRVIEDEDVSGGRAVASRGLEELIQRAENGANAGVLVYKVDRFGRDLAEVAVAVKRLRDAGARLVSADGYDSESPMGAAALGMLAGFAEYQLLTIKAGWERATSGAVASGIHISAKPPVGYERGADRRLVPDPATADAVRGAFERRAAGASHGDVVDYLRGELARPIVKGTVTGILSNRVYLGEARGPHGAVNRHAHTPLVDENVFQRVQALRGVRHARNGTLAAQAMLSGLITCASCGHKLRVMGSTNARTGEREASYVCATRFASGDCAAPAAARVKAVDEYVIELLADSWDEVTVSATTAEERYLAAREAVRLAEEALNAWVDDSALYVELGKETYRRGVLARQNKLEEIRREFWELEDPGLPDAPIVYIDGKPVVYEKWGDNLERDRQQLRRAIAEVTLAKADPKRRRWQPITERVTVRWVGEAVAQTNGPQAHRDVQQRVRSSQ